MPDKALFRVVMKTDFMQLADVPKDVGIGDDEGERVLESLQNRRCFVCLFYLRIYNLSSCVPTNLHILLVHCDIRGIFFFFQKMLVHVESSFKARLGEKREVG